MSQGKRSYRQDLRVAFVLQLFLLLLSSAVMDGGQCSQWVLLSMIPFWFLAGLIFIRRLGTITKIDGLFIRWGYLIILPTMVISTSLRWGAIVSLG